jgi:hypothetical protein
LLVGWEDVVVVAGVVEGIVVVVFGDAQDARTNAIANHSRVKTPSILLILPP